jgi:hypothetical protein
VGWCHPKRRPSASALVAHRDAFLDTAEIERLNGTFKPGVAAGTRYPAGGLRRLGL